MEITNENYEQVIESEKNLNILVVRTRCAKCPGVKAWWNYGPIINMDEVFEPGDILTVTSLPSVLVYRGGKLVHTCACESQDQIKSVFNQFDDALLADC